MATVNPFMNSLREDNLIDDREIAFVADITCTNGNRGRAWFFLNGCMLHLYEMVGMADRGEHIETLNLKGDGEIYTFKGFAQAKKVIACITESCE